MEKKAYKKKNPGDYIIMTRDINMFIVGMKTREILMSHFYDNA